MESGHIKVDQMHNAGWACYVYT